MVLKSFPYPVSNMRKLVLIATFCILASFMLRGQSVSLVLSGGGAKGLAHVGVIKALEEAGIPIDNISGTSIGAIVGGLYAMGYSPDEMIEIFKSKDFENWSKGVIDEKYRYSINAASRRDAENLKIGLTLDKKGIQPKITSSYVNPVGMDIAFQENFAQGTAISRGNFDSLFVPFLCNASDVLKKRPVFFRHGALEHCIRTSMTFPMYFKPIYIDSALLFDGGIYNNFIWREARESFASDYVIGSKVASNYKTINEESLILQLETMITDSTIYTIPSSVGMVIDMEFSDVTLLDFHKVDEIVKRGYDSALIAVPRIRQVVTRVVDTAQLAQRRLSFRKKLPPLLIGTLNVNGLNGKQEHFVNRVVVWNYRAIPFEKFKSDYYRFMSDEVFTRFYPNFTYNPTYGIFEVNVDAALKKAVDIGLGLTVSSSMGAEAFLSTKYSWLMRTSNFLYGNAYLGKLYNSARLTYSSTLATRIPCSFLAQAVVNRMDYHAGNTIPFFEDMKPAYIVEDESFAACGAVAHLSSSANISLLFSAGYKYDKYYQTKDYNSFDIPDGTNFAFSKFTLRWEKQGLNERQYATAGRQQVLSLSVYSGMEKHSPGSTAADAVKSSRGHSFVTAYFHNESYHKSWHKRLILGFCADAYWSTQNFFENYHASILAINQYSPTAHSHTLYLQNYRNTQYVAAGVVPIILLGKMAHIRIEAYMYQPIRKIMADSNNKPFYGGYFSNRWFIASGSLVFNTPIGPLAATVAYYPSNGGKELFYNVSFGYSIFNSRVFDN